MHVVAVIKLKTRKSEDEGEGTSRCRGDKWCQPKKKKKKKFNMILFRQVE